MPKHGPFGPLNGLLRELARTEFSDEDWEKYSRFREVFPKVEIAPEHPMREYLGSEQNDAKVLGAGFEDNDFVLTIDHYNVWRLAGTMTGWRTPRHLFPVTLRFKGLRECHALLSGEAGSYRLLRASRNRLGQSMDDVIELRALDASLQRFHLRISTWRRYPMPSDNGSWSGEYELFLECDGVVAHESLRENWTAAMGMDSLPIFEALRRQRNVQSWSVPDFEAFVRAHL